MTSVVSARGGRRKLILGLEDVKIFCNEHMIFILCSISTVLKIDVLEVYP